MVDVPLKYAFPLFTKHNSTDYLIKPQPKQFLHTITSRTIESAILKPNTANLIF